MKVQLLLALCFAPSIAFAGDFYPSEWEEPYLDDDSLGRDINFGDISQFDKNKRRPQPKEIQKILISQFLAPSCESIRKEISRRDRKNAFPPQKISHATQYFTPMFEPGENGRLQAKDRKACIKMEGSCVVDKYLYNWSGKSDLWGKEYERDSVKFIFGKGSGESYYNTTNALDPCRTLAADPEVYPQGTVIYIPSMRDKVCPQSGKTVDGCFIVGDVGHAIKGAGRFDIFTGECKSYDKSNSSCGDTLNNQFVPNDQDVFYVVGQHNILAKNLRAEADSFINVRWRKTRRR